MTIACMVCVVCRCAQLDHKPCPTTRPIPPLHSGAGCAGVAQQKHNLVVETTSFCIDLVGSCSHGTSSAPNLPNIYLCHDCQCPKHIMPLVAHQPVSVHPLAIVSSASSALALNILCHSWHRDNPYNVLAEL